MGRIVRYAKCHRAKRSMTVTREPLFTPQPVCGLYQAMNRAVRARASTDLRELLTPFWASELGNVSKIWPALQTPAFTVVKRRDPRLASAFGGVTRRRFALFRAHREFDRRIFIRLQFCRRFHQE